MASAHVLTLNSANFDKEVTNNPGLCLVDFWAEWCGPCRRIAPVIDQIAEQNIGRVKVGKVDVESNQDLAAKFGIQSIPTLLFFKAGRIVDSILGAVPQSEIQAKINQHA